MYYWFLMLLFPLCGSSTAPNIVIIVADDLGYNDISWHNPNIISPNLDNLARNGIILENHYVLPVCTPTRAALMTGYYPIHTGMQHHVLLPETPKGLFTNFTLMPEFFRDIGYRTHMVGKWHLGFCNEDYLPNRRGFDTFYGYYIGAEDYYKHNQKPSLGNQDPGFDFRDQDDVNYSAKGIYSSKLFSDRAVEIIKSHSANYSDSPLFLYLPFQSVHDPLQVPKEYEELYPDIQNKNRRIFSGMVSALDEAIGKVVDELQNSGLFDNSIILFTADNGGQVKSGGNNYPLRGNKKTLWEGGTKASSFIYSSILKDKGSTSNALIHIVDWLPTMLSAVEDRVSPAYQSKVTEYLSEKLDGIDQWGVLMGEEEIKRSEILYNIDPEYDDKGGHGALRIDDLKLILGVPGDYNDHYPPDTLDSSLNGFNTSLVTKALEGTLIGDDRPIYLFNLTNDPNEYVNIAEDNPAIVEEMLRRYQELESTMIPPNTAEQIEEGNPIYFDGAWSPGWCESEP